MKYIYISIGILIIFSLLRFIKQNQITGIGYKSRLSMKNLDTWNEANKYGSNITIVASILCIFLGIILISNDIKNLSFIFYINISFMLISCVFTEMHLKKIYDKDGNKK